jgi:phenylalanyl-tRNA synthetase beta chain
MNVSYCWLRELAPTIDGSVEALAERLTHTAVPVDGVAWLGTGLEDLVVARVDKVEAHPKADRLVICQVDAGRAEPVQVVTGAPVVVEGGYYPYVGAGQTLPGGMFIKKVKLRGEPSEGMLCSERELGIGRDVAGIMLLHGEYTPGQSVLEALELDDHRLDVDVTANRPDLLGHWGVARELAPGGQADLRLPEFPAHVAAHYEIETADFEGTTAGTVVRIEDPEGCPRYMGVVIRGVTIGVSPGWLANRLRAIGQQPINNVVDATNYVLHELNQPLHAFDLATLAGPAVVIRRAGPGESLRTLDGKDRRLDPEMLVIADAEVPTAMAGLMGGEATEVTEQTKDLFIECAYFEPKRVRTAAKALGLDSDASYRFQRGIDPEGLPLALKRVVELILTVAGGQVEGAAIDVNPIPHSRREVRLRPARVRHLLGVDVPADTVKQCLEPIGFEVESADEEAVAVRVPAWRPDVEREVDLIEEIARRHGYNKFPDELRNFRPTTLREDPYVELVARLRELMVGLGFLEAKSSTFAPEGEGEVRLSNPLSEREDHLRSDVLTGLLHRLEYNFARGERDLRLFEIGTVFRSSTGPLPEERIRLAAAWTGRRSPPHWSGDGADWDFWDLKSVLRSVASVSAATTAEVRPVDAAAEPRRRVETLAIVTPDGQTIGWAGRIPAGRLESPRWAGEVWGLEIDVIPRGAGQIVYEPLPSYPAVERDVALVVKTEIVAAELGAVIRETAPEYLEALSVFDVYEGAGIPDGTRSIAWRLRFRSADRTLTDDEVDSAMKRITSALEERLDVRIRGA